MYVGLQIVFKAKKTPNKPAQQIFWFVQPPQESGRAWGWKWLGHYPRLKPAQCLLTADQVNLQGNRDRSPQDQKVDTEYARTAAAALIPSAACWSET